MRITMLRKVGGSVMLVVMPALLGQLHLQAGVMVGWTIDRGWTRPQLVVSCYSAQNVVQNLSF
jgi:hypothetical protein